MSVRRCESCGAPRETRTCEYCGSYHDEPDAPNVDRAAEYSRIFVDGFSTLKISELCRRPGALIPLRPGQSIGYAP